MSNLLSVLFRKKNNSLNTKWHEVIIFYYQTYFVNEIKCIFRGDV